MPHETTLIATIAAAFVLAFALGLVAVRLRLPPLVGYLLAGVLIGPFTPGFVADLSLAGQLAEIGVILLMFGVGLHFSISTLLRVRTIALPGAVAKRICPIAPGMAMARTASRSLMEKCRPTPNISRITPISASWCAILTSAMYPGVEGPMMIPATR